jgi:oligoendopeptidase F
LLELRVALARNAGFGNYRDLRFLKLHRFDYGVKECVDFHDAVRSVVVPRVREMNEERKRCLGSATLRPWDYEVDPFTQAPFRPFRTEEELRAIARELFAAVDPAFAEDFSELERLDLLDLYSRPNKAPGGYQYFLEDQRLPFIFANAAGTHEDVQTLLHEGGHAFHSLLSRDEPLLKYRDPPIEFCEVASMGMEFLGFEHLEKVYPQVEARRIRRSYLEKTLRLLTWIATIDAFQHWVYSQSSGGGRERCAAWIKVHRNFSSDTDWSGLESYQEVAWHRQGHLFRQPFYYIEYGIALIGALQLWSLARRDPRQAVKQYRAALALGGSRALPELFAAAGLRFEFGSKLMRKLVEEVHAEWRKLHDQERRG